MVGLVTSNDRVNAPWFDAAAQRTGTRARDISRGGATRTIVGSGRRGFSEAEDDLSRGCWGVVLLVLSRGQVLHHLLQPAHDPFVARAHVWFESLAEELLDADDVARGDDNALLIGVPLFAL